MQATTSWEEKGQRSIVYLLLEQKVGQLPTDLRNLISTLASEKLSALAFTQCLWKRIALLNFSSIDDLSNWLNANR